MKDFIQLFLSDLYHQLRVVANIRQYIEEHEFRLTVKAIIVGAVVWGATVALRTTVHTLFEWTMRLPELLHTNWVILLPLLTGALLTALLSKLSGKKIPYLDDAGQLHKLADIEGDGVERTIALYYSTKPLLVHAAKGQNGLKNRWRFPALGLALRKFVATTLTVGLGGSGGLEASVTLMGEGLAAGIFKPRRWDARFNGAPGKLLNWWRVDSPDELQTLQLCSMAAAVSTLIGAPFMAAFFATEVMYRRTTIYQKFIYTLVAAVTAHLIGVTTNLSGHAFVLKEKILPPQTLNFYLTVIGVGIAVSLAALLFTGMHYSFDRAFGRIDNKWLRFATGAVATGLVAIIASQLTGHDLSLALGPGEELINEVLNENVLLLVAGVGLIAKLLTTSSTISSGGSAGLLVPALFFGAMMAQIFATLSGQPAAPLAAAAMSASLVSLVNVPLSSLIFVVEAFGSGYLVPALIAMIVSSLMAYDNSIYRTQREESYSQQLAPGYSIQRVPAPAEFVGQSIRQLDIQRRFEVNVIGLAEHDASDDQEPIIAPNPDTVLTAGDELVVLGPNEAIAKLWKLAG